MSSAPLAAFPPVTAPARAITPPQVAAPPANSFDTPISRKVSGVLPCTSTHYYRSQRMNQIRSEVSGKVIGPMPLNDFLDAFLPPAGGFSFSEEAKKKFDIVNKCQTEKAMYKPLIEAMQMFCPSLHLVDTHSRADKNPGAYNYKPDISAYSTTLRHIRNTNFSQMDFQIEVKYNIEDDPFIDKPPNSNRSFEHWSSQSRDTLGQLAAYALTHLGSQFRTSVFSLLLFKQQARIMRWDRAGVVATELFPLRRVAEFLWRYDQAQAGARGFDTSITHKLRPDIESAARKVLNVDEKVPLIQFSVPRGDEEAHYIGIQPVFDGTGSLTGRSTRAFPVFDPESQRIVFLKDTWRIDLPEIVREGEIYKQLSDAGVPNIAPFEMAADIPNHRTRTPDFVSKEWALPIPQDLRPHQHYRLVLGVVGRPLSSFTSTWELVRAIRDAICAHQHAYERGKVLHRDISFGNILIVENGGLLIDWDLCKPMGDPDATKSPRQMEHTGTWQFMSARLLKNLSVATHTLADDLESFFHVLTWVALWYTDHEMESNQLTSFMQGFYDECYPDDRRAGYKGGEHKASALVSNTIVNTPGFKNQNLSFLLLSLCKTLAVRYEKPPSAEEEKEYLVQKNCYDSPLMRKLIEASAVPQYHLRLQRLENSAWMLNTFAEALENQADRQWPAGDTPVKHIIAANMEAASELERKRKSNVSLDAFVPRVAKRPRTTRAQVVEEEDDEDEDLTGSETTDEEDEELSEEIDGDEGVLSATTAD